MQDDALSMLYDHGGERSGIPAALRDAGIAAIASRLPVGDYILCDRVAVGRKTGADLAASIKDRRLFEQTERLGDAYEAVVLIVEGEPTHIASSSWHGALARVVPRSSGRKTQPTPRLGWSGCCASRGELRARRADDRAHAVRPATAPAWRRMC